MNAVFFTGASSFSGHAFAKELALRQYNVFCSFTRGSVEEYDSLRRRRIEDLLVAPGVVPIWNTKLSSTGVIELIQNEKISVFCHHAADVTDYKSQNYDIAKGLTNNTEGLPAVFQVLRENQGIAVLTGTFSEPNEGWGEGQSLTFNPYSLTKNFTWELAKYHAWQSGIRIRKFIMGTPFGPWEGRGFTSYLASMWLKGETPTVKTPDYVRDVVPISFMAERYADFIKDATTSSEAVLKAQASGFSGSNTDFVKWFAENLGRYLGVKTPFRLDKQTDFSEPLIKILGPLGVNCSVPESFWKELSKFYQTEFIIQ